MNIASHFLVWSQRWEDCGESDDAMTVGANHNRAQQGDGRSSNEARTHCIVLHICTVVCMKNSNHMSELVGPTKLAHIAMLWIFMFLDFFWTLVNNSYTRNTNPIQMFGLFKDCNIGFCVGNKIANIHQWKDGSKGLLIHGGIELNSEIFLFLSTVGSLSAKLSNPCLLHTAVNKGLVLAVQLNARLFVLQPGNHEGHISLGTSSSEIEGPQQRIHGGTCHPW